MKWFRFYAEARTDPKVMALPGNTYKAWVEMLCLACEAKGDGGYLPPAEMIAVAQHWSLSRTETTLEDLINHGLLDRGRRGLRPHGWQSRQYKSDVSTERVRKHRNGVTPTVTVPLPKRFGNAPRSRSREQNTETDGTPIGVPVSSATATARAREPTNIFTLFEELTGRPVPTAILADELKEAEREHTRDCIAYAFREAAANEACTWSYVKAIFAGHAAGQCGVAARKRPQRRDAKAGRRAAAAGAGGAVPAGGPDLAAIKRYAAGEG